MATLLEGSPSAIQAHGLPQWCASPMTKLVYIHFLHFLSKPSLTSPEQKNQSVVAWLRYADVCDASQISFARSALARVLS